MEMEQFIEGWLKDLVEKANRGDEQAMETYLYLKNEEDTA